MRKVKLGLTLLLGPVLGVEAEELLCADNIEVQNAWVRECIPGSQNTAAFLTLVNKGDGACLLISAASTAAKRVELHGHSHEKGVAKMQAVHHIAIPAKSQTALKPGGLHVMLMEVTEPLKAGGSVQITMAYADGSEKPITLPIQTVSGGY